MAMTPIATTSEPPMAWPTVTIGARTFVVKFNQRAMYLANLWGYDVNELVQVINPTNKDPRRTAFVYQLFAVCTAHNFQAANPPQKALTAEEWMDFLESVIPSNDPIGMKGEETAMGKVCASIGQAVMAAVVKRSSDRIRTAAPTPTAEPAPNAPVVQ